MTIVHVCTVPVMLYPYMVYNVPMLYVCDVQANVTIPTISATVASSDKQGVKRSHPDSNVDMVCTSVCVCVCVCVCVRVRACVLNLTSFVRMKCAYKLHSASIIMRYFSHSYQSDNKRCLKTDSLHHYQDNAKKK